MYRETNGIICGANKENKHDVSVLKDDVTRCRESLFTNAHLDFAHSIPVRQLCKTYNIV